MIIKNLQPTTYHLPPKKGFTLVEMLVVIAVIGILYLIVFGSVSDSKKRGRDSKRIADISVIQLALERYYDENKIYPIDLTFLYGYLKSFGDTSLPTKDPLGNAYLYSSLNGNNTSTCSTNCQSYHLGATLELNNNVLVDDKDLNLGLLDFDGADTPSFVYDVLPKF